jgi:hypothetical protein
VGLLVYAAQLIGCTVCVTVSTATNFWPFLPSPKM